MIPIVAVGGMASAEGSFVSFEVGFQIIQVSEEDRVMVVGYTGIFRITAGIDDLASLQQVRREHAQRQVGLDQPRRGHLVSVFDRLDQGPAPLLPGLLGQAGHHGLLLLVRVQRLVLDERRPLVDVAFGAFEAYVLHDLPAEFLANKKIVKLVRIHIFFL